MPEVIGVKLHLVDVDMDKKVDLTSNVDVELDVDVDAELDVDSRHRSLQLCIGSCTGTN